jgi:hypothetical protein
MTQSGAVQYRQPAKKDKTTKLIGEQYHLDWETVPAVHVVKINSDFWKTQFQECLSIPAVDANGQPTAGAITLYAASNTEHITYAKQVGAEKPVKEFKPGVGDIVVWKRESRANHYGDASYLAKCAGHFCGVRVVRTDRVTKKAIDAKEWFQKPTSSPSVSRFRPDGRPYMITDRRSWT